LAEKLSARNPNTRAEISVKNPLTNGSLKNALFSEKNESLSLFTKISPSDLRTAIAIEFEDLIITPSITACPPIRIDFLSFKIKIPTFLSSIPAVRMI